MGTATRSPAEHSLASRFGAHQSWANTTDRAARTAPARKALAEKFLRLADPDGVLPVAEREARAQSLRKAHYARMALKSAQARRRR